jgi:CRP/FNR family transcriptional regulator
MINSPSNSIKKKLLLDQLGFLLEDKLLQEIYCNSQLKQFQMDDEIIHPGDNLLAIPIVLEGSIKVSRENGEGEELLLYYIEGGDTCAMTLQCCSQKTTSEIRATCMENALVLMIPREMMGVWMNRYKSWREFILQSYHTRMMEMMETIDAIAFMRLDKRLLKYLKDQAKLLGTLELQHTHQQIADDLHSSRVVISRLLKQLEVNGIIRMMRNRIFLKEL